MSEFDSQLSALSKKQDQLNRDYAQVLAKIDAKKEIFQAAKESLSDLGYSSLETANARIEQLRQEIQLGLDKIVNDLK